MSAVAVSVYHHLDPWLQRIVNSLRGSETLEDASDRLRPELAAFAEEVVGRNSLLSTKMNSDDGNDQFFGKRKLKRRLWQVGGNISTDSFESHPPAKFRKYNLTDISNLSLHPPHISHCHPVQRAESVVSGFPTCFGQNDECQNVANQLAHQQVSDATPWLPGHTQASTSSYDSYNGSGPSSVDDSCAEAEDLTIGNQKLMCSAAVEPTPAEHFSSDKLQQVLGNQRLLARAVRTQHARIQLLSKSLAAKTNQCNCLEDEVRLLKEDLRRQKDSYNQLQHYIASAFQTKDRNGSGDDPFDGGGQGGDGKPFWWDGGSGGGCGGESDGFGRYSSRGPPDVC